MDFPHHMTSCSVYLRGRRMTMKFSSSVISFPYINPYEMQHLESTRQTWLPNYQEGITLCCPPSSGEVGLWESRGERQVAIAPAEGQSSLPCAPPEDRRRPLFQYLMGLLSSCFKTKCIAVVLVLALKTGIPHLPTLLDNLAKQYCQIQMKRCRITVESGLLYSQHCLE